MGNLPFAIFIGVDVGVAGFDLITLERKSKGNIRTGVVLDASDSDHGNLPKHPW